MAGGSATVFILPTDCWHMELTHWLISTKTQFPPTDLTWKELSCQVAFSPVRKSHLKASGVTQSKGLETRVCVVKWHSRDAKRVRISERAQTSLIHKVAGTESQHFCRRNNELCTMQGTWVASWPVQFIKDTRPDRQRTDRFFCAT